jgi:hypothetical protein
MAVEWLVICTHKLDEQGDFEDKNIRSIEDDDSFLKEVYVSAKFFIQIIIFTPKDEAA